MKRSIWWISACIIALIAEVASSMILFTEGNFSTGIALAVFFGMCCIAFAFGANLQSKKEREPTLSNLPKWMSQWKEVKSLNIPIENEHFFLERRYLDDFSKELISHAKSNVLIANPFIQPCDLSDMLRTANKRGVAVQIITRRPSDKTPEYRQKFQEYHLMLRNEGISITYDDRTHAKLIIADNTTAVVSSMNFIANSSAGASWEAGLVTMNPAIVESITKSFSKVFNEDV